MSNNINNNNEERYCGYFNMSYKQLQEYKDWKKVRFGIYIVSMCIFSIFYDRFLFWMGFTLWFYATTSHDRKCEEQWIKDGAVTKEHFM